MRAIFLFIAAQLAAAIAVVPIAYSITSY